MTREEKVAAVIAFIERQENASGNGAALSERMAATLAEALVDALEKAENSAPK